MWEGKGSERKGGKGGGRGGREMKLFYNDGWIVVF